MKPHGRGWAVTPSTRDFLWACFWALILAAALAGVAVVVLSGGGET